MSTRYRVEKGVVHVDLRLKQVNQLFDLRDPSPFLERDLDDNAVDYIVSATMEHSLRTPIKVTIFLSEPEAIDHSIIIEAIHNHFAYDAELAQKKLRKGLRQGQMSLVIGLTLLFTCVGIAYSLPFNVAKEGFTLIGWVAMWKPINEFLYGWWPQLELVKTYKKLSQVPIEIKKY